MSEILFILPAGFWAVVLLLGAGFAQAWKHRNDGSGLPMMAVLGTVTMWYVGDAFYNDYPNNHAKLFDAAVLQSAWWQVACFVAVFLLAVGPINRWLNLRSLQRGSGVLRMFRHGVDQPFFQRQLNVLFQGCVLVWIVLAVIAAIRLKSEILYYFFPFLGYKAEPWGRARIGAGFDALLSFAFYIQLLVTAIFGVAAALATNRKIRTAAIVCCLVAWPYFVFDRTRNTLLAAVIPGILSWGLLRVRGGVLKKGAVLGACFLIINGWMAFVIANRSVSVVGAFREKGFHLTEEQKVHHEGLNMYEELCWINTFMKVGSYQPNWGTRYFAEAVNFIPRSLWPGKPLIGIDYAIARGQSGGNLLAAGVYATISTGMIGQGVVNFGRWLGPVAAAILMAFWVATLARLDLHIHELGRMPMYATGLILTFNLGRDITLITLYPFVFGAVALWCYEHFSSHPHPIWPMQRPEPVPAGNATPMQRSSTARHNVFHAARKLDGALVRKGGRFGLGRRTRYRNWG